MKRTFPLPRCAIGLLLALSLFVLPSLPVFAGSPPAQSQQVTQTITLTGDASVSGEGYSWDHNSKTLTLNGLDLSVADGDGISLPEGSSVVLSGKNTISVSGDGKAAFQTTGALTFSGEGTLAVTVSAPAVFSKGTVTVNGGILELPADSAVTQTGGMVFIGNTGSAKGNVTLPFDYTLPAASTLTVESGATLTIPKDTTLAVENGATLTNNGAILNAGTLTETVSGTSPLTAYQVTITQPQNGTLSVSGGGYTVTETGGYLPEGKITASVTPDQGFQVTKYSWNRTESDSKTHQLAADVTVTATLSQSSTAVESVTVEPATLGLNVNETKKLTATVSPADAENKNVTWASNNTSVATVDEQGNVMGLAKGTATITATSDQDGTTKGSCTVTVYAAVESVTVEPATLELVVGKTGNLTATVLPADAPQAVTWASNNTSVATVDEQGNVTGLAKGTATITATSTQDETKIGSCTVTVYAAVESVKIESATLSLNVNETKKLTATVSPADAGNKNVTWASNNISVATVDAQGNVTGLAKGIATITATSAQDGTKIGSCTVNVLMPVSGVSLDQAGLSLAIGGTAKLTATVSPVDASNPAVTWKSDNERIASVDQAGNVTGRAIGTTVVTVTTVDGGHTATCQVTVGNPVTGITLNRTSLRLERGSTTTLTATIAPSTASNPAVTWTSSDSHIVSVTTTGRITGHRTGSATITATTQEGGYSASCRVTVYRYYDDWDEEEDEEYITGEAFWDRVLERVEDADNGDTVNVYASDRLTIPIEVLEELEGYDVTLLIHWSGDDIAIYGEDMDRIDFDRSYYTLRTLSGWYGIEEEEEYGELEEVDFTSGKDELPEPSDTPSSASKPSTGTGSTTQKPTSTTGQTGSTQTGTAQGGGEPPVSTGVIKPGETEEKPKEETKPTQPEPLSPAQPDKEEDLTDTLASQPEEQPGPAGQSTPASHIMGLIVVSVCAGLVLGGIAVAVFLRMRSNRY